MKLNWFLTFLLVAWSVPSLAQETSSKKTEQVGLPPGVGMEGFKPPALSKTDVEKLVVAIPEMARMGGNLHTAGALGANAPQGAPQPSMEDLSKLESLLGKYGFGLTDFFLKMTALVSTYLLLRPEEFEKQLPSESSPQVQEILNDSKISDAEKAELKKQIAEVQANKEVMRAQLSVFASEGNKVVVRPMLAKVQKALEIAEAESKKIRQEAIREMNRKKAGPRKESSQP